MPSSMKKQLVNWLSTLRYPHRSHRSTTFVRQAMCHLPTCKEIIHTTRYRTRKPLLSSSIWRRPWRSILIVAFSWINHRWPSSSPSMIPTRSHWATRSIMPRTKMKKTTPKKTVRKTTTSVRKTSHWRIICNIPIWKTTTTKKTKMTNIRLTQISFQKITILLDRTQLNSLSLCLRMHSRFLEAIQLVLPNLQATRH